MAHVGKLTPAIFRRAFFLMAAVATGAMAALPPAPSGELAQIGKPDAAEAHRLLQEFRDSGVAGEYYFEFDLHELPRRGDESVFHGRLWGGRNAQGAVLRVELTDAAGGAHRLLVQNGERAAVWRTGPGGVAQVAADAALAPLVPGVELSAFDLQMPFLYWPDATVESLKRVFGRPAHEFIFRPPATFAAQHPELAAVRSYFDTQYNKPMQTERLDATGRVTRTWSLVELKTVGGQTIPKAFEVRDETTRDKTRLVVTAAALNLDLPGAVFAPGGLTDNVRPPAAERIVRLTP